MDDLSNATRGAEPPERLRTIAEQLPLIAALSDPTRERLIQAARIERYPARAEVFAPGVQPRDLYIVMAGIVDLACSYEGHECSAVMMAAGDMLMPAAALHEEPFLLAGRTLSATRLMLIDAEIVRQEAARSPELALSIGRIVAGQWRMAVKIILDLKCRSPSQRLAAFLLRLHDARAPGTLAEVPFSKRQLASRIGMQPETLSRTLQTLAANGLFLRGRQIVVNDRSKIQAFCGPDPYPRASEFELGVHAL